MKSIRPAQQGHPVVLLTGGGTQGHISPALAIGDELGRQYPELDIRFVGTSAGLEAETVPRRGYEFIAVTAIPFRRTTPMAMLRAARALRQGMRESEQILQQLKPVCVIGTGGYAAGPLLGAARKAGVPYIIHEANAYPGRSNRVMSAGCPSVCISYEEARPYFSKADKVVLTGNPVDQTFFTVDYESARKKLGLEDGRPRILVSGGSRGAKSMNDAVVEYVRRYPDDDNQIVLVTGQKTYEAYREAAQGLPEDRLQLVDYIFDMPWQMAAADVCVTRAGAMTCAESAALGTCSIFVPFPYATGDHQTHNAQAFSEIYAGILCPDEEFDADYLHRILLELADPELRKRMRAAARSLARPDAASAVAAEFTRITGGETR